MPAAAAKECVLTAWAGGVGGIGATIWCVAFLPVVRVRRVDIIENCERVELHQEVQEFFKEGESANDDGWIVEEVCDGASLVAMPADIENHWYCTVAEMILHGAVVTPRPESLKDKYSDKVRLSMPLSLTTGT